MPTQSHFQTGEIPHGFLINEAGGLIHHRYGIVLAVPIPNQSNSAIWGDGFLSFGSDWADVRLRVALHNGTTWTSVKNWDIKAAAGRLAEQLPAGTQKVSIGRVKQSAGDMNDNSPVSWLLEYV
ncbi:hypothetical protein P3T37_001576 [Kitasatospora sp. MAA4]|uniref:hypothetical protein n=1 Tax=Kitasatospora sp. MAA4 TaxID=3035093 RepID=UPI002475088F|nr:hypothetical protein [Kitasatospora sp. MAA4]MDH6132191.1 hypothetical protein [Kitasatospora sp. MAA4]